MRNSQGYLGYLLTKTILKLEDFYQIHGDKYGFCPDYGTYVQGLEM